MAMRTTRRLTGWILGVGAFAVATSAYGGDAAKLVGPDAFFFAESARPDSLLDRISGDRESRLLKAIPSYAKFFEKPEIQHVRMVVELVTSQLGTTWDKAVRDLSGGGIVVAGEGTTKVDRTFLIVTPKDPAFLDKAHAKLLELARNDAKGKGNPDPVNESEHRGIKVFKVSPTEAHAIVRGMLVISNGDDAVKTVIDRALDAKSPTILDDPQFASQRKNADPEALAWSFARTDRLRAIDPARYASKPDAGATFLFGPWIEAAQKGEWAAASLTWTEKRLSANVTIATPKDGYSSAMKRYLPGKEGAANVPISVPNLVASGSLWRDFSAIWDVRAEIFPPETVQGLAQLDTQAGTFFGGRDFGTGVLGALGSHWNIIVAEQDFDAIKPSPDVKLPAFALILELKPDDDEFATRLKSAFQSFIGLVNLGAAQTKAQPLMLGSETIDGLAIATSKYLPEKNPPKGQPVNTRYNFAPSAVQVGNFFVISSNLGLAKDLVKSLKEPLKNADATLLASASGPAVAGLLERNKSRLVMQNMLEKGNAKEQAEAEIGLLLELVKYLGQGRLSATDTADSATLKLDFELIAK